MVFNSITYVVFLILVTVLYWILPRRPRIWMIFLSSCTFYGFWRYEFLPIMLLSAVTDYLVSLKLEHCENRRGRVGLLMTSLVINLGLLFYFKYTLFFLDNVWTGLRLLGVETPPPALNIILPLGISFYTFQTISYTVDVYRGFIKPERDFALYASYVTFFPQLVAGPILRAGEVIWQLTERPVFRLADVNFGLRRILYGVFLKVVLADNIAPLVNTGFAEDPHLLSAFDVCTLAFLFGYQIYFDFCAYSHIAVGSARLMGIILPENFNFPYLASSPQEFWRRWHISLSSWIRDYLYLPLCGAKVRDRSVGGLDAAVKPDQPDTRRKTRALFLTWGIMGLWHGANWTFVFWGLYHAAFVYTYRRIQPHVNGLATPLRVYGGWCLTLLFAMLSWIPFRAPGLGHTFTMYGRLFVPRAYTFLGLREHTYVIAALILILMVGLYALKARVLPALRRMRFAYAALETLAFTAIIMLVIVFLRPISQFIYFQF